MARVTVVTGFADWGEGAERRAATGVRKAAEHVLTESRRVVPLEEATLERSGRVDADGLQATISYGTEYAVIQHEELGFEHPNGRQAKYLEGPLFAESRQVADIIAAQIRRAT